MKRGIEVLFPPPQPGPSEEVSVIHQLRNVERLIMKDHIISELPYRPSSCYPPNFPSCLQRPGGRKKRERIPPRRLLRRKIILQQKVILKEHSFLNNLSTFSYQGKHPLALPQFLHLRPYPQRSKNSYMNLVIYFPKRYPLGYLL